MSVFWSKPFPPNAIFSVHPFMPNTSSPFSSSQQFAALPSPRPISIRSRRFLPDKKDWTLMVKKALEEIEKANLEKIVLARVAIYECTKPPDPFALAALLQSHSANATVFCFSTEDRAFLGATPELLFSRQNNCIETVAMAGTRKRGNTAQADKKLEQELLQSPKDLHEWSFIPRHFQNVLAPLCTTPLTFSPLCVYKTPTVQHLYSHCRATLKPLSDTEILQKLHPTPALCGTPTDAALSLICELEPFDRGLYGGTIGWTAPEASEYHVAIRSCFISGNTLYLYSGTGIVAGSHPHAEWEELNHKLKLFEGFFT